MTKQDSDDLDISVLRYALEDASLVDMYLARKLRFILLRYEGHSVAEACDIVGVCHQTGYNWQFRWNTYGLDGLIPSRSSGKPASLTHQQLHEFADTVADSAMSTAQARELLTRMFGISFTEKHISEILREEGLSLMRIYDVENLPLDKNSLYQSRALHRWIR